MRPKPRSSKNAIIINAAGRSLGRVCSEAARCLMGKHLPSYQPRTLAKVSVVIQNVSAIRFSGSKLDTKQYHRFTGYPGGLKTSTLRQEFAKHPERLVHRCVEHMLPKNRLASRMMRYLTVSLGEDK